VHGTSRLIREAVAPGGQVADRTGVGVGAGVGVGVAAGVGLAVAAAEEETAADGVVVRLGDAPRTEAEADGAAVCTCATGFPPPNGGSPRRPLRRVPMARITRPIPTRVRREKRPHRPSRGFGAAAVSLARTVPRA
jgi:hypothetical protein